MAKLRIVSNRAENSEFQRDLRGFNDPAVFSNCRFNVRLLVHGEAESHTFSDIQNIYGLKIETHNLGFELSLKNELSGEHKKQALKLFFASLEVCRKHTSLRCCIYQINGMMNFIKDRIHSEKCDDIQPSDQLPSKWLNGSHRIFIDHPCSLYLHQAEIQLALGDGPTLLRDSDIEILEQSFTTLQKKEFIGRTG